GRALGERRRAAGCQDAGEPGTGGLQELAAMKARHAFPPIKSCLDGVTLVVRSQRLVPKRCVNRPTRVLIVACFSQTDRGPICLGQDTREVARGRGAGYNAAPSYPGWSGSTAMATGRTLSIIKPDATRRNLTARLNS